MKHLSLETCKRKDVIELLKDVECEKVIMNNGWMGDKQRFGVKDFHGNRLYKAPNLEEAIELLPIEIEKKEFDMYGNSHLIAPYIDIHQNIVYYSVDGVGRDFPQEGETLLQAIEKMLLYLLDNKLIGKK